MINRSELYTPLILTRKGVTKESLHNEMRILHIGCGGTKIPGAIGIDVLRFPGVDHVHDLDAYPWPVESGAYDVVYAHSVVEHITDIVAMMEEVWRILVPGGRFIIVAPYFRNVDAFTDPTHTHFFTSRTLDYFTDKQSTLSAYAYSSKRFHESAFWYGWPHDPQNPIKRLLKRWMTRHPRFFDQYASLLYPVSILIWELEKIG